MSEPNLRTWEAWRDIHQPFELDWWREALANGHDGLTGGYPEWDDIRGFIEPTGVIIDIGCGPRPPFRPCTVIEPLAMEYQKITPPEWWQGVTVLAQPAEEYVQDLGGDTIICWNCLDHTIGWREILYNMKGYGKPGAKFALATDFQAPFIGHPGYPHDEFEAEVTKLFKVVKRRAPFGRELALLMIAR